MGVLVESVLSSKIQTAIGLHRLVALVVAGATAAAGAATYTVVNTSDSGIGSLRQAIIEANASPGLDEIVFNIPGTPPFLINVGIPELPPVDADEPVVLDATTQPGYSHNNKPVILNGAAAGTNATGLLIRSGSSVIRGLVIMNFGRNGIELNGPAFSPGSNVVESCFIGTDRSGTTAAPNGGNGIFINRSTDNRIGGVLPGAGNVLSGNAGCGLWIGDTSAGARNIVVGNRIGTTAAGTSSLANAAGGINIDNAPSNVIGGTNIAARNIISGNGGPGITIDNATVSPSATNNSVLGNFIGTDLSGTLALNNGAYGVSISGLRNFIGGTNAGAGNVISGNSSSGVDMSDGAAGNWVQGNLIGVSASGLNALPNGGRGVAMFAATNNVIGGSGPGARNIISGNALDGVAIVGSNTRSNFIEGNFIGVDITGTNRMANGFSGVWITNAPLNFIGSSVVGGGNVVSGNTAQGITIYGTNAFGNVLRGNLIGLDATGTRALSNRFEGVWIANAPSNYVGSATVNGGNTISGNGLSGLLVQGSQAVSNFILGNLIGLSATGTTKIGNGPNHPGIFIEGAPGSRIGDSQGAARNIISGNGWDGIRIQGSAASNSIIQGNYIGTDISGTLARGNALQGIIIKGDPGLPVLNTLIGGAGNQSGNVISANGGPPAYRPSIDLQYATGTVIQGNLIGVAADGITPLSNIGHNIDLESFVVGTAIGGTNVGEGNIIAHAQDAVRSGIRVRSGCTGNVILGNSMFSNGKLGITFNGSTPLANDDCDADLGPNNQQNYPVLSAAVSDGSAVAVTGYLNSTAGRNYLLQFYGSPVANPTSFGEGKVYLGSSQVMLAGVCSNTFSASMPAVVPTGWVITATATDQANNTSEFSKAVSVGPKPALEIISNGPQETTLSWLVTNSFGATWQLMQADSLNPPVAWATVPIAPTVSSNGTYFTVTLSTTSSARFFRLRLQ